VSGPQLVNPLGETISSGQPDEAEPQAALAPGTGAVTGVVVLALCSDGEWRQMQIEPGTANVIVNVMKNQACGLVLDKAPIVMKKRGRIARWLRNLRAGQPE
jgi:hypothetical protein